VPKGAGSVLKQSEKNDEIKVAQHSTLHKDTTFYYISYPSGLESDVEEH